jgi:hypothetical protein
MRALYPKFRVGTPISHRLMLAQIEGAADIQRRQNLVVKGDGLREVVGAQ